MDSIAIIVVKYVTGFDNVIRVAISFISLSPPLSIIFIHILRIMFSDLTIQAF